jgi:3-dehydroquinate synthetase
LGQEEEETLIRLLQAFKLPQTLPADISSDAVMTYLQRDKKFVEGKIRFVLLRRLGDAFVSSDVNASVIRQAVEELSG